MGECESTSENVSNCSTPVVKIVVAQDVLGALGVIGGRGLGGWRKRSFPPGRDRGPAAQIAQFAPRIGPTRCLANRGRARWARAAGLGLHAAA